jgi:WD40 repeat protein
LETSNEEVEAERQAKEAARKRELAQAQELAESRKQRLIQQQRAARRLRKLIVGLAVVAVIAGLACVAALISNQRANKLADEARLNADKAKQSQQETENALAVVESQKAAVESSLSNAEAQSKIAEEARKAEARQRNRAEGSLYAARLSLIENALRAEDAIVASQILDKCLPQPGQRDRRGWEWHYLHQWAHAEQASWQIHPSYTGFAVAFNPDDRSFAWAGGGNLFYLNPRRVVEPGEAAVCEFPSGKVRFRLRGHGHLVLALAYSPDGKRVATASTDKTVKLWNAETGTLQATLKGHAAGVNAVSWNPDGRRLASGSSDGTIKLWDATTLKEIASFKGHEDVHKNHGDVQYTIEWWRGVSTLSWDQAGRRLASASNDGTVKLWDEDLAKPLIIPSGQHNLRPGKPAAWSPDGARVACGYSDTQVHIHDATTGKRLHVLESLSYVRVVAFSPDGRRLAGGGENGVLRLWDAHTGKRLLDLLGHENPVTGLSFSPDSRRLLSCGLDGTVKLWNTEHDPPGRAIPDGDGQIAALSFTPDGTRFRAANPHFNTPAGGPFHFRTWDSATGKLLDRFEVGVTSQPAWPRGDFAFSPDARLLLAPPRDDDKIAAIWDAQSGKQIVAFRGHSNIVTAAAFSPKGDLVASAARKGKEPAWEIKLWDAKSGAEIRTFTSVPYGIQALAFSLDGRKLASGGMGAATVWETTNGKLLRHMGGKIGMVMHLTFHPDGVRLAAADYKLGSVHVWNADTGEERIELPGAGATSCVGYSPDGRRLAAMGYDANVRLWDADSEQDLFVLRTFAPPPGTLGFTPRFAFSPDGSPIVANSAHGILSLWDAGTDAKNKRLQADRAASQHALGLSQLDNGELEAARKHLEQAVALREALARDEPNNAQYQADLTASRLAMESLLLHTHVLRLFERFDGYCKAGKTAEAAKLLTELLADVRKLHPKDSPQLAGMLALFGLSLLQAHAFPDAEPLLRECLAIREKTQSDAWNTFNAMSMLGGALLGQKKYADAEPMLLKGYGEMKQREKTIPPESILRIPEALDRLIEYYTATNKPEEAKKWRAERAKYPQAKQSQLPGK